MRPTKRALGRSMTAVVLTRSTPRVSAARSLSWRELRPKRRRTPSSLRRSRTTYSLKQTSRHTLTTYPRHHSTLTHVIHPWASPNPSQERDRRLKMASRRRRSRSLAPSRFLRRSHSPRRCDVRASSAPIPQFRELRACCRRPRASGRHGKTRARWRPALQRTRDAPCHPRAHLLKPPSIAESRAQFAFARAQTQLRDASTRSALVQRRDG
mmetsp:Transcript_8424/g.31351  ORF Transcript_8424/g.31351 Transcript_8424/m.31351 type:complete len:211 (+) Transcript_8424:342-974(+)